MMSEYEKEYERFHKQQLERERMREKHEIMRDNTMKLTFVSDLTQYYQQLNVPYDVYASLYHLMK